MYNLPEQCQASTLVLLFISKSSYLKRQVVENKLSLKVNSLKTL